MEREGRTSNGNRGGGVTERLGGGGPLHSGVPGGIVSGIDSGVLGGVLGEHGRNHAISEYCRGRIGVLVGSVVACFVGSIIGSFVGCVAD